MPIRSDYTVLRPCSETPAAIPAELSGVALHFRAGRKVQAVQDSNTQSC